MGAKLKRLLGSLRFWQVTFANLAVYIGVVISNGFSVEGLFTAIATWFAIVAGIGTFDKAAKSIGGS